METIKSPAKINLGLWILRKRTDEYHDIYTVIHTIDLHDIITIKPAPKLEITFSNPNIPEENTVTKAVRIFEETTGIQQNYKIFIQKNIPIGSGLGGGSSNAAVILKKLNELSGSPLTQEELHKLAVYIGADVPFFLEGGMAVAQGIGDKITYLKTKLEKEIFIIYPNIEVKTKEVYSKVTSDILTTQEQINIIDTLLKENRLDEFLASIENSLGNISKENFPVINEVLNTLEFLGYKGYITGSGSAVFVFGKPNQRLKDICKLRDWKLYEANLI
ncbi:MAG: 4-(cytidine 5'-diphospho)-2-C-methyl-D-erythritol kinase [Aquificae bacterium]|nr:4-(cytidine 5'-diphospho)-2-C-methyl-D-erythritol kinase [Aquificota bacterium]